MGGSVVVRLDRLAAPPVDVDPGRLWRVVDAAFAERRKTMRNAVVRLGLDPGRADDLLTDTGIDPRARAEQLALDEFARIAEAVPDASPRSVTRDAREAQRVPARPGRARGRLPRAGEPGAPAALADLVTVTEADKLDVVVDAQVDLPTGLDAGGMNLALWLPSPWRRRPAA